MFAIVVDGTMEADIQTVDILRAKTFELAGTEAGEDNVPVCVDVLVEAALIVQDGFVAGEEGEQGRMAAGSFSL